MNQIHKDVLNILKMIEYIYKIFDLNFVINLLTRSKKYIGTIGIWNQAENILEEVMKSFNKHDEINKNIGDGVF